MSSERMENKLLGIYFITPSGNLQNHKIQVVAANSIVPYMFLVVLSGVFIYNIVFNHPVAFM
jgi:hypothetical protein